MLSEYPHGTENPHGIHDIPTVPKLQRMVSPMVLNTLHGTHVSSTCIMISSTVLSIPHDTQNSPHSTHDILHGTQGIPRVLNIPHGTQDIPNMHHDISLRY